MKKNTVFFSPQSICKHTEILYINLIKSLKTKLFIYLNQLYELMTSRKTFFNSPSYVELHGENALRPNFHVTRLNNLSWLSNVVTGFWNNAITIMNLRQMYDPHKCLGHTDVCLHLAVYIIVSLLDLRVVFLIYWGILSVRRL